jgi:hypothetical protein
MLPPAHQETSETSPQTAKCPKRFSCCLQWSSSLSSDEARSAPRKPSVPASIVEARHVTGRSRRGCLGAPAAGRLRQCLAAYMTAWPGGSGPMSIPARFGYLSADQGGPMRTIIAALAATTFLTSCVSGPGSQAQPPNYVSSQAHQAPAIRNDTFGGAAMPMRGLPR